MKKILATLISLSFVTSTTTKIAFAQSLGVNKNVIEQEVTVTTEELNVRTGPSIDFPIIGTIKKDIKLVVIGAIGDWYVVQLPDNSIGVISNMHVKVNKMGEFYSAQGSDDEGTGDINETETEKLFRLINETRKENNLSLYTWDVKLNKIADLKAADMVNNKYFSHDSEAYGTPFVMLKQMGVSYKSASENLARNNSIENAHMEILSSPSHRANVLNSKFNKVGIGISESKEWGKIIVELFVEE